jgi:two-component sensor histidine kinase
VTNGDGWVEIAVEDTGVGLPAGFDPRTSATFGFQLVCGLVAQVGGTLTCDGTNGMAVKLVLPMPGA